MYYFFFFFVYFRFEQKYFYFTFHEFQNTWYHSKIKTTPLITRSFYSHDYSRLKTLINTWLYNLGGRPPRLLTVDSRGYKTHVWKQLYHTNDKYNIRVYTCQLIYNGWFHAFTVIVATFSRTTHFEEEDFEWLMLQI